MLKSKTVVSFFATAIWEQVAHSSAPFYLGAFQPCEYFRSGRGSFSSTSHSTHTNSILGLEASIWIFLLHDLNRFGWKKLQFIQWLSIFICKKVVRFEQAMVKITKQIVLLSLFKLVRNDFSWINNFFDSRAFKLEFSIFKMFDTLIFLIGWLLTILLKSIFKKVRLPRHPNIHWKRVSFYHHFTLNRLFPLIYA